MMGGDPPVLQDIINQFERRRELQRQIDTVDSGLEPLLHRLRREQQEEHEERILDLKSKWESEQQELRSRAVAAEAQAASAQRLASQLQQELDTERRTSQLKASATEDMTRQQMEQLTSAHASERERLSRQLRLAEDDALRLAAEVSCTRQLLEATRREADQKEAAAAAAAAGGRPGGESAAREEAEQLAQQLAACRSRCEALEGEVGRLQGDMAEAFRYREASVAKRKENNELRQAAEQLRVQLQHLKRQQATSSGAAASEGASEQALPQCAGEELARVRGENSELKQRYVQARANAKEIKARYNKYRTAYYNLLQTTQNDAFGLAAASQPHAAPALANPTTLLLKDGDLGASHQHQQQQPQGSDGHVSAGAGAGGEPPAAALPPVQQAAAATAAALGSGCADLMGAGHRHHRNHRHQQQQVMPLPAGGGALPPEKRRRLSGSGAEPSTSGGGLSDDRRRAAPPQGNDGVIASPLAPAVKVEQLDDARHDPLSHHRSRVQVERQQWEAGAASGPQPQKEQLAAAIAVAAPRQVPDAITNSPEVEGLVQQQRQGGEAPPPQRGQQLCGEAQPPPQQEQLQRVRAAGSVHTPVRVGLDDSGGGAYVGGGLQTTQGTPEGLGCPAPLMPSGNTAGAGPSGATTPADLSPSFCTAAAMAAAGLDSEPQPLPPASRPRSRSLLPVLQQQGNQRPGSSPATAVGRAAGEAVEEAGPVGLDLMSSQQSVLQPMRVAAPLPAETTPEHPPRAAGAGGGNWAGPGQRPMEATTPLGLPAARQTAHRRADGAAGQPQPRQRQPGGRERGTAAANDKGASPANVGGSGLPTAGAGAGAGARTFGANTGAGVFAAGAGAAAEGTMTAAAGAEGTAAAAAVAGALPGVGYKYRDVVRRKADREALGGFECHDCARFYDALRTWGTVGSPPPCGHEVQASAGGGGAGQQRAAAAGVGGVGREVVGGIGGDQGNDADGDGGGGGRGGGVCLARGDLRQDGSRHRYRFAPPATPTGFWDMGFGDSLDSRLL